MAKRKKTKTADGSELEQKRKSTPCRIIKKNLNKNNPRTRRVLTRRVKGNTENQPVEEMQEPLSEKHHIPFNTTDSEKKVDFAISPQEKCSTPRPKKSGRQRRGIDIVTNKIDASPQTCKSGFVNKNKISSPDTKVSVAENIKRKSSTQVVDESHLIVTEPLVKKRKISHNKSLSSVASVIEDIVCLDSSIETADIICLDSGGKECKFGERTLSSVERKVEHNTFATSIVPSTSLESVDFIPLESTKKPENNNRRYAFRKKRGKKRKMRISAPLMNKSSVLNISHEGKDKFPVASVSCSDLNPQSPDIILLDSGKNLVSSRNPAPHIKFSGDRRNQQSDSISSDDKDKCNTNSGDIIWVDSSDKSSESEESSDIILLNPEKKKSPVAGNPNTRYMHTQKRFNHPMLSVNKRNYTNMNQQPHSSNCYNSVHGNPNRRDVHRGKLFNRPVQSVTSSNKRNYTNTNQQPSKSYNSVYGNNVYNPNNVTKTGLRPIIIDGCNVAFSHGRTQFSTRGLQICIEYFCKRGHKVQALLPRFRRSEVSPEDRIILDSLYEKGNLVYTPSRFLHGQIIAPYDDRFIVQAAAVLGGVIVSSDNYRDLVNTNESWRETIEKRLLMFTWVGDMLMFPSDPYGRAGPKLEELLRFPE